MGSEDLFKKKRGPKTAKDLARRKAVKSPLAKILIVCEGKKTEPNYFEDLINHFKLLTASVIDVTGECGSSPMCVVRHAKEQYKKMAEQGAPYDQIFVVIDKDAHTDYVAALDALRRSKPSSSWFTVNSVPCFEYWLLLHYTYSTKAFRNLPGNSSGNQIVSELKKHIKNYEKGSKGIFHETLNALKSKDLNEVVLRAKRSLQAAEASDTDNPSTKVFELVERLIQLKKQIESNRKQKRS
ncbi:RloB domain-containing protein [Salmonella enterica]|uniref:RloB domain-containing protein n=2 Tax=Salmonella enterica TaxID=28901 RepID=A0A8F0BLW5_SALER|nr:RloB domain-containing protein [Salmonella enterica subsp. enterica serovar Oranienburg]EAB1580915.1 RloB domain-containing protein [Salmonella enterica]EDP9933929.1 RloB domain-containing protein [Salmonella enterica subsp. enterica]EAB2775776.1 RloB domain-containing protein [Salmonella enterica]EAM5786620.1 RloB domain-containing protein [Salmonella enterica]